MFIPSCETDRLTLRPFASADVNALHEIFSKPTVLRYFPNQTPPNRAQVERIINFQLSHWEKHGYGWWAVELTELKKMIGWCGLQFLPETGETEVAYLLEPEHWGHGFGTEAARYSLHYGFIDLGIKKIVAIVHPDNLASRRVIEKLGMHFVDRASYFGMDCFRYDLDTSSFKEGRLLD